MQWQHNTTEVTYDKEVACNMSTFTFIFLITLKFMTFSSSHRHVQDFSVDYASIPKLAEMIYDSLGVSYRLLYRIPCL